MLIFPIKCDYSAFRCCILTQYYVLGISSQDLMDVVAAEGDLEEGGEGDSGEGVEEGGEEEEGAVEEGEGGLKAPAGVEVEEGEGE